MLAIAGPILVASIVAMYAGNDLAKAVSMVLGGTVLFGLGGKIAHYKYRDPNIKGNANAWFSGWRHSVLADGLAIVGFLLIGIAIWPPIKTWALSMWS